MRAAQEGHQEVVEALLGQGADVNKRNHERMNALMLASQRGHDAIVKMLIDHGASRLGRRPCTCGKNIPLTLFSPDSFQPQKTSFVCRRGHRLPDGAGVHGADAGVQAAARGGGAGLADGGRRDLHPRQPQCVEDGLEMGIVPFLLLSRHVDSKSHNTPESFCSPIHTGRTARDTALKRNNKNIINMLQAPAQVRLACVALCNAACLSPLWVAASSHTPLTLQTKPGAIDADGGARAAVPPPHEALRALRPQAVRALFSFYLILAVGGPSGMLHPGCSLQADDIHTRAHPTHPHLPMTAPTRWGWWRPRRPPPRARRRRRSWS